MDMETIEARVKDGAYDVVEALEFDVMLVALNVLLTELPARNAMKDLCRPAGGEIPRLLAPVMPYVVSVKGTGRIGVGLKAMGWIQLTWQACNHLGHLTRAEAAAVAALLRGATGRTRTAATAATRRNTAALKRAGAAAAESEPAQTAGQSALRPPSIIEYQVRVQPLPFPKPFKAASCACLDHKALGMVETDGIDKRELAAQDGNTNNAGAMQAAAKREAKLEGLTGRERQLALLELERGRYCTLMKLQPAHDYEIKVRAFVTAPAVPGEKGGRERAFGTWSRSIRVRTPNAPPSAPQDVRFELNKETSVYIRWEEPSLLHGGGLIDYEVRFRILAIGDVILGSGAGGRVESASAAGSKMSRKEARFYEALALKYHGDRRLSQGGAVSGGLWALGHTLNPLLPATQIEVTVRAKNSEGWGDVAAAISTRTLSALPEEPQDVSVDVPRPQTDEQLDPDVALERGARGESRGGRGAEGEPAFWMCFSVSWTPPPFTHSPLGILRYEVAIDQWDPEQSPDTLPPGTQPQGQDVPHPMEPPALAPLPMPRFPSDSRVEIVEVREEEPEEEEEEGVKKAFVYDLEQEFRRHCLVEEMRCPSRQAEATDEHSRPMPELKEDDSAHSTLATASPEARASLDKSNAQPATAPPAHARALEFNLTDPAAATRHATAAGQPGKGPETLTVRYLHPGAHVRVSVRATNEVGASEWTKAVVVQVPFRVPSRPLNLVLQAISEHRVQRQTQRHTIVAHWDPPVQRNGSPIAYYEVVYIAGGAVRMKRVSGSVTGVRLQGFAPAQAIEAKVIAINGMGKSEPSSPRYTLTHPGPSG